MKDFYVHYRKMAVLAVALFTTLNIFAQSGGATMGERVNMGLYGGASNDLTYSPVTHRLFACVETPASLFYTDDTCYTWHRAFQNDSLEFMSGSRGWGGGGRRVLCNNKGWVAVATEQHGGNLTAAVLSKNDGDSGTFFTVMDEYILHQLQPATGPSSVTAIAMNDSLLFIAMRNFIYSYDGNSLTLLGDISTISGTGPNDIIFDMTVPASDNGYPLYLLIGHGFHPEGGDLYKLTSAGFAAMTMPTGLEVQRVFTHPHHTAGDTLIISCVDPVTHNLSAWRSLNGGTSWADISPTMTHFALSDVDYSPAWVSSMPVSYGMRIVLPGAAYSDNLGNTWHYYSLVNNSNASHPANPDLFIGTMGAGPVVSTNGYSGPFVHARNYRLSAVKANKIARSKGVYYLSTNAGLAYTTAYFNPAVAYEDRWKAPYGDFPVPNVGDDAGITSVAIDPDDSLHVIAGYSNGFSVTTTGPSGFTYSNPPGWNGGGRYDQGVSDIKFINSDTIIATTGSKMNQDQSPLPTGNIWRSTDGGTSWTKVTPAGLEQPNCVAVGHAHGSTVVYVGAGHFEQGPSNTPGSLWKSTDYGITWTKINDGPNSIAGSDSLMPVYDIVVDTNTIDTIFIASGKNLGHAFVISYDGGATYNYTPVTGEGEFTSVMQYNPNLLFVANRREIFSYQLNTGSWALANRAMPGEFIPDLERGSLLAATNTGLYKIVLDSATVSFNQNQQPAPRLNAFPNPFGRQLTIRLDMQKPALVRVQMMDITGKIVLSKEYGRKAEGHHQLPVSTGNLAPGIYLLRLDVGGQLLQKKMIKL